MNLDPLLNHIEPDGRLPPVECWQPSDAGEMDLEIAADGRWYHEGSEMTRPRLVRLLSTLLRREDDGHYYLVTPVEKLRIRVVDRPFVVIDAEHDEAEGCWWLTTHVGDRVRLDETHRLQLSAMPEGGLVPEVPVRFGLCARLGRNVFYRLVEHGEQRQARNGVTELGLTSAGVWHPLGELSDEAS